MAHNSKGHGSPVAFCFASSMQACLPLKTQMGRNPLVPAQFASTSPEELKKSGL
jgi:hypothetical protein